MQSIVRWLLVVVVVLGLSGCGGGGGTSSATSIPSEVGKFLDSAVGGADYITSSGYKGTTNSKGEYKYNDGDTVEFFVGSVSLGKVKANNLVTIFDLKDSEKVALLLQTLDEDMLPDNGIQISDEMKKKLDNASITIHELDPASRDFNDKFKQYTGRDLASDSYYIMDHATQSLKKELLTTVSPALLPTLFDSTYHDRRNFMETGLNPKDFLKTIDDKTRVYFLENFTDGMLGDYAKYLNTVLKETESTNKAVGNFITKATDVTTEVLGIIGLVNLARDMSRLSTAYTKDLDLLKKIKQLENNTQLTFSHIRGDKKVLESLVIKSGTAAAASEVLKSPYVPDPELTKILADCIALPLDPIGKAQCYARVGGNILKESSNIYFQVKQFVSFRQATAASVAKIYLAMYYSLNFSAYPENAYQVYRAFGGTRNMGTITQENDENFEEFLDQIYLKFSSYFVEDEAAQKSPTSYSYKQAKKIILAYQNLIDKLTREVLPGFKELSPSDFFAFEMDLKHVADNKYKICGNFENRSRTLIIGFKGKVDFYLNDKPNASTTLSNGRILPGQMGIGFCSSSFEIPKNPLESRYVQLKYDLDYRSSLAPAVPLHQKGAKFFEVSHSKVQLKIAKPIIDIQYPPEVYEGQEFVLDASGTTSLNPADTFSYKWDIHVDDETPFEDARSRVVMSAPSVDSDTRYKKIYCHLQVTSNINHTTSEKTVEITVLTKGLDRGENHPPVITLIGQNPELSLVGNPYHDAGVTVVDDHDKNVQASVMKNTVDTQKPGEYLVVYRAVDSEGAVAIAYRKVYVISTTGAPDYRVISLPDSTEPRDICHSFHVTGCEASVEAGKTYTKSWTFKNLGNVDLTGLQVVPLNADEEVTTRITKNLPDTIPVGSSGTVTMEITVPDGARPGVHKGNFKIVDEEGDVPYEETGGTAYFWYMFELSVIPVEITLCKVESDAEKSIYTFSATLSEVLGLEYTMKISLDGNNGGWQDAVEMATDKERVLFAKALKVTEVGDRKYRVAIFRGDQRVSAWVTGNYQVYGTTAIPQNLRASITSGGVLLQWDPVEGALSYVVMRSLDGIYDGDYETINNITATQYLVDKSLLLQDETLYFSVGIEGGAQSDRISIIYKSLSSSTSKLKKTGQTKSYDQDGNEVTDKSLKDDGYYQAGVAPNYSRDPNTGIVTDHVTGLEWQDDADPVKKPWLTQENYDKCTGVNGQTQSNSACFDTSGDTAATYCSTLLLDGGGWRLPTAKELDGIVDYGRREPAIDPVFQNIALSTYWSSSTYKGSNDFAWNVGIYGSGSRDYNYKDSNSSYVRCTRIGK